MIKFLVENKADLKIKNAQGHIPFHFICQNKNINLEMIRCFVDGGSDLNLKDVNDRSSLQALCGNPSVTVEIIKYLVDKKADVDGINSHGNAVLHFACNNENINFEIIKFLVENKADLNLKNEQSNTPLQLACINKNTSFEIIKYLIEAGADPTIANNQKVTPVQKACVNPNSNLDIVKFLMEQKGVNAEVKTNNGETVLHFACYSQNPNLAILRYLIEDKKLLGLLTTEDNDKDKPLHLACANFKTPVSAIEYLLTQKPLTKEDYYDLVQLKSVQGYDLKLRSNNQVLELGQIYLTVANNKITHYSVLDSHNKEIHREPFQKPIECPKNFKLESEKFGLPDEVYNKLLFFIVALTSEKGHTLQKTSNILVAAINVKDRILTMSLLLCKLTLPKEHVFQKDEKIFFDECQKQVKEYLENNEGDKLKICKKFLDNLEDKPLKIPDFFFNFKFFTQPERKATVATLLCLKHMNIKLLSVLPKPVIHLILLSAFVDNRIISQDEKNINLSLPDFK